MDPCHDTVDNGCRAPARFLKNTRRGKPFIYRSTVELQNTDLSNSRKQELKDALINQMDDSLKVRTVIAVDSAVPSSITGYPSPLFLILPILGNLKP